MPLSPTNLSVDFSAPVGTLKELHGVNLGPVSWNGYRDVSEHFRALRFPYVRLHDCPFAVADTVDIHNIFPFFDADPLDPRNYRFAITDDYIQSTLDTGARIVYRLGESIEHHSRRKYYVHPPRDFQKWADICVQIIRHYNEGWADGFRHGIRYWEVWNEPWLKPLCWTGTHEEYYRLYEITAKTIKKPYPGLAVGGPSAKATIEAFAEGFLTHCQRTNTPLDFFSWHMYARDPQEITESAGAARRCLDAHGFTTTELHLNEWNYTHNYSKPVGVFDRFGTEKKARCARSIFTAMGDMTGAAFAANTLILLQDCPVEMANYYWAKDGLYGLFNEWGECLKKYHAFLAFRRLLDAPVRVNVTANDPTAGYAALGGRSKTDDGCAVLLSNFRSRSTDFEIHLKGWPWQTPTTYTVFLLDHEFNLESSLTATVTGEQTTLRLHAPSPTIYLIQFQPAALGSKPNEGDKGINVLP